MTNKRIKILCVVAVLALSVMQVDGLIASESVDIILPEETITLYSPFEIKNAVMYRDGGTIAIVIKDGKGSSLPFCLDGRLKRPSKVRPLYVGAMHPGDAKAKQVPIGSPAEKSILKILKSATIGDATLPINKDLVTTVIGELENR